MPPGEAREWGRRFLKGEREKEGGQTTQSEAWVSQRGRPRSSWHAAAAPFLRAERETGGRLGLLLGFTVFSKADKEQSPGPETERSWVSSSWCKQTKKIQKKARTHSDPLPLPGEQAPVCRSPSSSAWTIHGLRVWVELKAWALIFLMKPRHGQHSPVTQEAAAQLMRVRADNTHKGSSLSGKRKQTTVLRHCCLLSKATWTSLRRKGYELGIQWSS